MAKSRGQTCYEKKKDLGGKERGTRMEDGKERRDLPRKSEGETTDLAQKRANVDKIGGGSLQLLAGMSGNAWDSILKARPRQSLPPLVHSLLSLLHQRLLCEAPILYRMTPRKRRDYLPILLQSHRIYLIHEMYVIY